MKYKQSLDTMDVLNNLGLIGILIIHLMIYWFRFPIVEIWPDVGCHRPRFCLIILLVNFSSSLRNRSVFAFTRITLTFCLFLWEYNKIWYNSVLVVVNIFLLLTFIVSIFKLEVGRRLKAVKKKVISIVGN